MVRAMFTCEQKVKDDVGYNLIFSAVTGDTELAEKFFKYTPYGTIMMGTINEHAAEQFEVGRSYFVDFTPAE